VIKWLKNILFSRPATPGSWYLSYYEAWSCAHPDSWENGTGGSGHFCKGNIWVTGTPAFDRKWFRDNGMKPPIRIRVADMGSKPGEIRIAKMIKPGESVPFVIRVNPK
jgi:hypothetical protein